MSTQTAPLHAPKLAQACQPSHLAQPGMAPNPCREGRDVLQKDALLAMMAAAALTSGQRFTGEQAASIIAPALVVIEGTVTRVST